MHVTYRNVNDAFYGLIGAMYREEFKCFKTDSRFGPVIQVEEPIIVTYRKPLERVLLNRARDANPFFHCFESMWMLAGRNDVAPLKHYISNFDQFSDDGKIVNDAYGYRWRRAEVWNPEVGYPDRMDLDQLDVIVEHFKKVPNSRRVVLQMWNVQDDLLKIGPENQSKAVACNTAAYFSLRVATREEIETHAHNGYLLDMTVTNRSNDIERGMLGANVVHFSFLQEYLAARIGVGVGVYNQFSNNLHVYQDRWNPVKWLKEEKEPVIKDVYGGPIRSHVRLVKDPQRFDLEVKEFIDNAASTLPWQEPFLAHVASPMCRAFQAHKERKYSQALEIATHINDTAWRVASIDWLDRRAEAWKEKQTA